MQVEFAKVNLIIMAFLKYIIDLIIVILLSSCSNQEDKIRNNEEELLSFDVSTLDYKEYEIKLSDLMESVEIVQLDNLHRFHQIG